jgi:hypothetical protein
MEMYNKLALPDEPLDEKMGYSLRQLAGSAGNEEVHL